MFFFFKQKTAYEMLRSLVGSEMCIRDSFTPAMREADDVCFIGSSLFVDTAEALAKSGDLLLSLIHI